jgi:hypothetical protein
MTQHGVGWFRETDENRNLTGSDNGDEIDLSKQAKLYCTAQVIHHRFMLCS